jgi:hypothetical protein
MRRKMPRNCQFRLLRFFRETVFVEDDVRAALLAVGLRAVEGDPCLSDWPLASELLQAAPSLPER